VDPEQDVEPDLDEATEKSRKRWLMAFAGVAALLGFAILLIGWNRVAHSTRMCAQCHTSEVAIASAERSVHSSLSCLDCHTGPGLAGSLRYVPTLLRETVANVTGWGVAHGVLEARPCTDCHTNLTSSPALKVAHQGATSCATCHGEVSHPNLSLLAERPAPLPEGQAHPDDFVQNHGEAVADSPDSCQECHKSTFCQACHFKALFPHPEDWIEKHGPAQIEQGPQACTSCHPESFCVGCHGTEIPHKSTWLGEHWRDLEDASVTPCLVCHAKTDCTSCHSQHNVHREQDLFVGA
jgi:hypothetical protein